MFIRNLSKAVSQPKIVPQVKTKKVEEVQKNQEKKKQEEVKKVINYCPIWIRKNI